MDNDTASAIVSAQLSDLNELEGKRKAKGVEGSKIADEDLAIDMQVEELNRLHDFLSDSRMAASIGRAVRDDGPAVVIFAGEERCAVADREMARDMAGLATESNSRSADYRPEESILAQFESLNIDLDDDAASCFNESLVSYSVPDLAESSRTALGPRQSTSTIHVCVSCDERAKTIRVPCGHYYCQSCTAGLYLAALEDETLYPVRCCREPIPMSLARRFLSPDLAARTEWKAIEFGTPNRIYCSNAICSSFISPDHIDGRIATCAICERQSCTLCRFQGHDGGCPEDPELDELLRLAAREGWQSCSRCHAVVELRAGCNHIT